MAKESKSKKNKIYDILKWAAITGFPVTVTLLATVLPSIGVTPEDTVTVTTVVGSIGIALGGWLGISSSAYNKQVPAPNEELYTSQEQDMSYFEEVVPDGE